MWVVLGYTMTRMMVRGLAPSLAFLVTGGARRRCARRTPVVVPVLRNDLIRG